ncbi:MAG: DUF1638 domain-containing protein, partial [Candidatus Electrothrix sp. ATG1]|nr:DUF1638 domain-containing protein [Candidatus Electrothrix sp. ATG1]
MRITFCFIVCENFAPEVTAALRQQGLTEAEVREFSSHCCSAPLQWSELSDIVSASTADVFIILGSFCLRKLIAPPAEFSRCHVHQQGQCLHLLCNPTLVETLQQNGTYLLSPGWLSRWQTHIADWGFNQSTAVEFLGKSLRKLLLLDTGTNQDTRQHLTEFGEFLQLPTDSLPVGLEYLD